MTQPRPTKEEEGDAMSTSKTYDVEETREEQAQRLCAAKANDLANATRSARKRFALHVAHLTPDQRRSLVSYLRRDFEQTVGVIEDINQDVPEFGFSPSFVDGSW